MIKNAPWEIQFWNHFESMIYTSYSEAKLLKIIEYDFTKFENYKSFNCQNTAVLYQLFLNTIFEENNLPCNTSISIDNYNEKCFIVKNDDLTEEMITAFRIMW